MKPRLRHRRQTPLATEHFVRQADVLNRLVVSEAQFVLEGQNAALLHYKHRFTELLQKVMKLRRDGQGLAFRTHLSYAR